MTNTLDYEYALPPALIAQEPRPRGDSRLMTLCRGSGAYEFTDFGAFPAMLRRGDVLVINDTRVSARRLYGSTQDGTEVEVLLIAPERDGCWSCLAKPARRLAPGEVLSLRDGSADVIRAEVLRRTEEGGRVLRFLDDVGMEHISRAGEAPLPPYIHRKLDDDERYQTIYADRPGSAAAPTAGLHFSNETLEQVRQAGAKVVGLTLHVGVDTFRPVRAGDADNHVMHGEAYTIPGPTADAINERTGRVVAVGTTVVRALESSTDETGEVAARESTTRLFIRPGYRFRIVDAMLTNFHLPRSTLLMLVAAFAGREAILNAYEAAIAAGMRFYSFGDAMFIA